MSEWTHAQKYYAEYVLGSVESGCNYASVNMRDPITIGIGQWYAYNAAGLMERLRDELPDNYALLSSRMREALDGHDSNDRWWTGFYLYQDDADSFIEAAQDKQNHAIQDAYFQEFMFGGGGEFDTLASWGMNTDNVKETIFMMCAYHQTPASAGIVLGNIGGERTLDEYYNAVMSTSPFYSYEDRYSEAKALLEDWDGTSEPPDFGQSDYTGGSNPDTNGTLASAVNYVELVGNDLIVYGSNNTGNRLICHNTGNGVWKPVRSTTAGAYPSTSGGGGGEGSPEDFANVKALYLQYEGQFGYAQAPGRLEPHTSGFTDCSAGVWWGYNYPNDYRYEWLGTSTYTMWDTATLVCEGIDESKMKPGDLILMKHASYEHAAIYWDDGSCWGCGSSGCPKQEVSSPDGYWSWGIYYIAVYRVLGE